MIPALGRWHEEQEFRASLGSTVNSKVQDESGLPETLPQNKALLSGSVSEVRHSH